MKTLYLIRHAKSSWNFDLPDHDRPLGVRGRRDVRKVGQHLSNELPTPDLMITSTASRAFYTTLFIADEWGYPEEDIIITKDLFHADVDDMIEIISKTTGDTVSICGHNPGFTELYTQLTGDYLDNLPTAGVMGIKFNISSWAEVKQVKGKKFFSAFPKKLQFSDL